MARFQAVAEMAGARADGALYWKAYALDKLGQRAEALTAIADLARAFPKSRWLGDARALEVQVRTRVGQTVVIESGDDELKLLALNALQFQSPEQVVPMLRQLLQGAQPLKLKERALFILAQSSAADARRLLADVARQSNPDLQRKAIDYLGVHGSPANRALLGELYRSADDDVKRRILRAYMVSGRSRTRAGGGDQRGRRRAVRQGGGAPARRDERARRAVAALPARRDERSTSSARSCRRCSSAATRRGSSSSPRPRPTPTCAAWRCGTWG